MSGGLTKRAEALLRNTQASVRRIVHTSTGTVHLEFSEDGQVEIALYDETSAGSRAETWPEADLAEGLAHVAVIPVHEAEEIRDQLRAGRMLEGLPPERVWPRRYRALQGLPVAVVVILVLLGLFVAAGVFVVWLL